MLFGFASTFQEIAPPPSYAASWTLLANGSLSLAVVGAEELVDVDVHQAVMSNVDELPQGCYTTVESNTLVYVPAGSLVIQKVVTGPCSGLRCPFFAKADSTAKAGLGTLLKCHKQVENLAPVPVDLLQAVLAQMSA